MPGEGAQPLSRPAINAIIAGLVTLVSWGAVVWGLRTPGVLSATENTPGGVAIGLALAPAIIAPMMLALYLKGVRTVRAARRGEGVLARWIVTADEMTQFRANNAARNKHGAAYRNDWKPPRRDRADGLEVIFMADAVVVGGALFPLVNTGMFRFAGVQVLPERPLAIEFGTVATNFVGPNLRLVRSKGLLRLPVARMARDDLPGVLSHFQQVDAREIVVNAGFYLSRIRIGLITAAVCSVMAAIAFVITPKSVGPDQATLQIVGMTIVIVGVIFGIAGLLLAAIAWNLRQGQLPRC